MRQTPEHGRVASAAVSGSSAFPGLKREEEEREEEAREGWKRWREEELVVADETSWVG